MLEGNIVQGVRKVAVHLGYCTYVDLVVSIEVVLLFKCIQLLNSG
jgi:hypothetical protein